MKKIVITFGLIAGAIVALMGFITMPLYLDGKLNHDYGEIVGYTSMVVALSMIFFGVKSYRDNHLRGAIKFGKAFQVGMLIAIVASLIYAIGWEINLKLLIPDFIDRYSDMVVTKAKAGGASPAEIQKVADQMSMMRELYKNPFLRFGLTLIEILPVGILIALLSATVLRKKEILPA